MGYHIDIGKITALSCFIMSMLTLLAIIVS
jgi:hypothetical protein